MIKSMRGTHSREGAAAEAWLSWVGNEAYLQLAMLADASDEGTRLVRQLDCDDLDEGEVVGDCEQYLIILRALFVDGQCLVAPGYTFYAIEALKKVRVNITSGTPKTFGGTLEPEVVTRTLRRMAAWVIMATHTIEAEFPGFELRSNFKVFALGHPNELSTNSSNTAKDAITRLAKAFHVDPDAALKEYYDLLPLAIRAKTHTGQQISNFDAWAEAMKLVSRRPSLKQVHPTSNIGPILMRYCAWASSTSEVERGFAVTAALKGGASEDFHCDRERDILTIATECQDPSEHGELICEASKIWREHFGLARAGCGAKARIDAGRSRRSGKYGTGEAAFIRLRRDAALTVANASVETLPDAVDIDSLEFTDAQQREIDFQHKKALKRKVMSFQAGHIFAEEVDLELEDAHVDCVNKARATNRNRVATNKRKLRQVLKTPINIEGISWWPGDLALDCAAIASELDSRNMVRAPSRMDAQMFVCVNPAEPSIKTRFVASMKGLSICNMEYIHSKGTSGVCLAYKPASMARRVVSMTDEFLSLHPILAKCILGVIDTCNWKLREVTDILAMLQRPGTAKQLAARQQEVLLFAADSDMDKDELSLIANKITLATCFTSALFSNYDVARCMAGYCGM